MNNDKREKRPKILSDALVKQSAEIKSYTLAKLPCCVKLKNLGQVLSENSV